SFQIAKVPKRLLCEWYVRLVRVRGSQGKASRGSGFAARGYSDGYFGRVGHDWTDCVLWYPGCWTGEGRRFRCGFGSGRCDGECGRADCETQGSQGFGDCGWG